jgi:hypothetical protein
MKKHDLATGSSMAVVSRTDLLQVTGGKCQANPPPPPPDQKPGDPHSDVKAKPAHEPAPANDTGACPL